MRQMFNEAQKAEIVAEAKVRPQREIAEERGCSQSTISRITNNFADYYRRETQAEQRS